MANTNPSAKSLANLTPIQPGQCLNPKGINGFTKSRERFSAAIEHFTAEPDESGLTLDQRLAVDVLESALAGNAADRKEVLQRIWPVLSRTQLSGDPDAPIGVAAQQPRLDNLSPAEQQQLTELAAKALQPRASED